ncbi:MAG: hypothetical protein KF699_06580 [Phycisphaeraceae bacterium]|nr:hypothetical protein [Phycisphaeraceae bacterium]
MGDPLAPPKSALAGNSAAASAMCPRCGYDLRGTTQAWKTACDLTGTCPECGLHFDWADLLREDRARLPGFVEHPGHGSSWLGGAFLFRALRTWTWALWPPRFFARVCMHHRFDVLRLLLWLPALCGTMYLAAAACMFAGTFVQAGAVVGPALAAERAAAATINDLCVGLVHVTPRWTVLVRLSAHRVPIWVFPGLAAWAVAPLLLLSLSDTRRLVKIRAAHVLRAAVYGCAWIVPIFALRLVNRAGMVVLVSLDRWVGTPRTLVVRTHWFSMLLPSWSDIALGGVVALWMTWWWCVAIARGWRLPRPLAVCAIVLGISIATGVVVLFLDRRMVRFLV